MKQIYQLLHSFQEENIALGLQLAKGQGYTDILDYWKGIEESLAEILYYNDWMALQTDAELKEDLSQGILMLSSSTIAPTAHRLYQVVNALHVVDSRYEPLEMNQLNFESDFYQLVGQLPLLELLQLESALPIEIPVDSTANKQLKFLSLQSEMSIKIPNLAAFPILRYLTLYAPQIAVEQGSSTVLELWIAKDKNKEYPNWLGCFPNLKILDIKNCNYRGNEDIFLQLKNLKTLCIQHNTNLFELPTSIFQLPKLEELTISDCSAIGDFEPFKQLKQLKRLNLKDTLHEGKYFSCDRYYQVIDDLQKALPLTKIELE